MARCSPAQPLQQQQQQPITPQQSQQPISAAHQQPSPPSPLVSTGESEGGALAAAADAARARAEAEALRAELEGHRRAGALASAAAERYAQELAASRKKVAGWASQMEAWREAADAWQAEAQDAGAARARAEAERDDARQRLAAMEDRAKVAEAAASREAAGAAAAREDARTIRSELVALEAEAEQLRAAAAEAQRTTQRQGDEELRRRVRELTELSEGLSSRVPQQEERIAALHGALGQLESDAATAAAAAAMQTRRDDARCEVLTKRVEQLKAELASARHAAVRAVAEVGAGTPQRSEGARGGEGGGSEGAAQASEPLSLGEAMARLAEAAHSGVAAAAAASSAASSADAAGAAADSLRQRCEGIERDAEHSSAEVRSLRSKLSSSEASIESLSSEVQSLHAMMQKVCGAAAAMVESERREPLGLAEAMRRQLAEVARGTQVNEARLEALEREVRVSHSSKIAQLEEEVTEGACTRDRSRAASEGLRARPLARPAHARSGPLSAGAECCADRGRHARLPPVSPLARHLPHSPQHGGAGGHRYRGPRRGLAAEGGGEWRGEEGHVSAQYVGSGPRIKRRLRVRRAEAARARAPRTARALRVRLRARARAARGGHCHSYNVRLQLS